MGVLAGAAVFEITPEGSVGLMGYGAREGRSTRVHDPLQARGIYLAGEGPGDQILILSADLCLMAPDQAARIRAEIAARTDLDPARILVSCSHTHSGPDTGLAELAQGRPEPEHVAPLFAGLVEAGVAAVATAAPARLRWLETEARIGANRRLANGPLDPAVTILELRHTDDRPLAILFVHACHGTVLGHDNLEVSADWAGVTMARVSEATGAVTSFVLGAHADIDPRTRGLMDLAIPGQSRGMGFEAVRVLGEEVADAVLAALASDEPLQDDARIGGASARVPLPVQLGVDADPAAAVLSERKRQLASRLGVQLEAFPRLSSLGSVVAERAQTLPLAEARALLSETRLYVRDKTAPFFCRGEREASVEAQVLRIGDAVLLGLPVEPTTQVGLDWKARMRARFPHSCVAGIANGWLRYLPHPDDLAHPRAHEHYEVLESILAPGACEALLACGEKLAASLDGP